jgi:hypothetical protein
VSLQGRLAHFDAPGARRGVRGARPARPSRLVSGSSTSMGGFPCKGVRFGGLKLVKFGLLAATSTSTATTATTTTGYYRLPKTGLLSFVLLYLVFSCWLLAYWLEQQQLAAGSEQLLHRNANPPPRPHHRPRGGRGPGRLAAGCGFAPPPPPPFVLRFPASPHSSQPLPLPPATSGSQLPHHSTTITTTDLTTGFPTIWPAVGGGVVVVVAVGN